MLKDYINENNLLCLTTKYQKRTGQLWTHKSPNRSKAQLDYEIINRKWKNNAKNCRAFNSFVSVASDHRAVSTQIRPSLRENKKKNSNTSPYDWTHLKDNPVPNTQHLITRVKNRFAALQDTTLTNSAKTKYNHFELACKETAADTIPLKPKIKKRTPWETEEICQKRKHLHEAAQVWKIDDFHQVLLDFCNNVHNQDPINRWRKGCLLPIPKKGNLAITKNYR